MAQSKPRAMRRPSRWDEPFGTDMSDDIVEELLSVEPFLHFDRSRFPSPIPLDGILRNDTRVVDYEPGDVVIWEGDYGNSAFLVLSGEVIVCLDKMERRKVSRKGKSQSLSLLKRLKQILNRPATPELRELDREEVTSTWLAQSGGGAPNRRMFVQDIPRMLEGNRTVALGEGEVFGELAALTRSPRSATVVAHVPTKLLEIRWQGLRELTRFDPGLKQHVERLYRQNSLNVHLRETPLLSGLSPESLLVVADRTRFESYGDFDWHQDFRATKGRDMARRVEAEPRIAARGDYPDGLVLIRSGFARLSRPKGAGEETIAYLGKGHIFGLEELWHNWIKKDSHPLVHTLRAIGYVDILRIPTDVLEDHVLPFVDPTKIEFSFDLNADKRTSQEQLEFLVDQRLINGTQAMVIDLDRCTRCDDCVRACAIAHDNNPRFVREGPTHENLMFAGACMHCVDPVCMIGCPTGAIGRESESGTISIRDDICIGCSTCANSCPYDNIRMVEIRDRTGRSIEDEQTGLPILKATKCDLCSDQPHGPACQRSCPHQALVRIDMRSMKPLQEWTQR